MFELVLLTLKTITNFLSELRSSRSVSVLTTADSSPTPVSDDCVLLTLEHWSSVAHKVLLAIEHRSIGAAAPRLWNSLPTCYMISLGDQLRDERVKKCLFAMI